jgi:hypothetical protein
MGLMVAHLDGELDAEGEHPPGLPLAGRLLPDRLFPLRRVLHHRGEGLRGILTAALVLGVIGA